MRRHLTITKPQDFISVSTTAIEVVPPRRTDSSCNERRMSLADPWFWTVEILIEQLCRSSALFAEAGCDPRRYPALPYLEQLIRQHQIGGATFLQSVDERHLQDILKIEVASARQNTVKVIELLRSRSLEYQQRRLATATAETLHISETVPISVEATPKIPKRVEVETVVIDDDPLPDNSLSRLSELLGSQEAQDGAEPTSWNYLLKQWQENDQEEIVDDIDDEYDDDDDDMDLDDGSEPDEQDSSPVPKVTSHKRKLLGQEEVIQIINDHIESFTKKWVPGQGGVPGDDLADDELDLWNEAEASGERDYLIKLTKERIEMYELNLNNLCREISELEWKSPGAVQRLFGTLEATIELLEQEKWELCVYEMPSAPLLNDQTREIDLALQTNPHNGDPAPSVQSPSQQPPSFSRSQANEIVDLGSGSDISDDDTMIIDEPDPLVHPMSQLPPSTNNLNLEPKHEIASPTPSRLLQSAKKHNSSSRKSPYTSQTPTKSRIRSRNNPEDVSIATVSKWDWNDLRSKQDRKRILMKSISAMSSSDRETVRTRVANLKKKDALAEIPACIAMMIRGGDNNNNNSKMQGVLPRDSQKIIKFTNLFLCWWLADNYLEKRPSVERLKELAQCLESGAADQDIFYDYLKYILGHTFSTAALSTPLAPSQAEIVVISSDEDATPVRKMFSPRTPRSKRTEKRTERNESGTRRSGS
ncbi:hypothetical protein B0J11DRAFT_489617 [Dendryphion nanum]|uniref:DUF7607 domain-containing protein n=1 Tax=Dendryphion nanum TaxID=256645 RepID=A0A9P9DNI6_9PLEO|nr:hypothetical protein B0J11DRAFT_489617 [Dendryphion nanum]